MLDLHSYLGEVRSLDVVKAEKNQLFGPGHNSFTRSEDGEKDILIYQARPKVVTEGDPLDVPDRHAHAQPFTWSDTGFPVFGEPGINNQ